MKRGERALNYNKVSAAESAFTRAEKMRPRSPAPTAQLGWCKLARKRYRGAIPFFKRALSKSPRHGDSIYGLGYTYTKLKRIQEARAQYELYLKVHPQGPHKHKVEYQLRKLR